MMKSNPQIIDKIVKALASDGEEIGKLGALKIVVSYNVPKGEIRINPESLGVLFTVSDS